MTPEDRKRLGNEAKKIIVCEEICERISQIGKLLKDVDETWVIEFGVAIEPGGTDIVRVTLKSESLVTTNIDDVRERTRNDQTGE